MEADTALAGPGAAVVFPAALAHPPSDPCRRSQDPERSAHSDRAASAHQRQPRAQDLVAERVRQDHSGDGGGVRQGAASRPAPPRACRRTAYPAQPLGLPSVRPSQHLHCRCVHCSGGRGCVRAPAPVLVRADHGAILTMTILTMLDHGELANAAARAQAGERQPHEEEAGVLVGGSASVRFWLGRCGAADSLVSFSTPSSAV